MRVRISLSLPILLVVLLAGCTASTQANGEQVNAVKTKMGTTTCLIITGSYLGYNGVYCAIDIPVPTATP